MCQDEEMIMLKLFLLGFVAQWSRSFWAMRNTCRNHPTKRLEKCVRFRECTLHQNWSSKDEAQEGRQT